jgi:hypothetical protein
VYKLVDVIVPQHITMIHLVKKLPSGKIILWGQLRPYGASCGEVWSSTADDTKHSFEARIDHAWERLYLNNIFEYKDSERNDLLIGAAYGTAYIHPFKENQGICLGISATYESLEQTSEGAFIFKDVLAKNYKQLQPTWGDVEKRLRGDFDSPVKCIDLGEKLPENIRDEGVVVDSKECYRRELLQPSSNFQFDLSTVTKYTEVLNGANLKNSKDAGFKNIACYHLAADKKMLYCGQGCIPNSPNGPNDSKTACCISFWQLAE